MKRALPFVVSAGLVVAAGSAFAQTMGSPPHALGSPAPAPVMSNWEPAGHAARMKGDNTDARSATEALNLLEARGYADFSNFTADGSSFRATVSDGDRPATVLINPHTGEVRYFNLG